MIKLAIHHRIGSFSGKWIDYCKLNKVNYLIVNCFDNDIIEQLRNNKISHLMWHVSHESYMESMAYSYVLNAADLMGIKTFPNFNSRWHFDDKVAQKYLFESIDAPMVKSYVFYDKTTSLKIIEEKPFPIVAKLKRGAGSTNVSLIKNKEECELYINKMFGEGIISTNKVFENFDQKLRIAKQIKNPLKLLKRIANFILRNNTERKIANREKGYFYFQDFMPNNDYDTRVIVIEDKVIAFKRFNKKGDFKASGSGLSSFENIDIQFVKIALQTSARLNAPCLAYDFIYDKNSNPLIIEVCFGFGTRISSEAPGYFDKNLNFIEEPIDVRFQIIKNFLKS